MWRQTIRQQVRPASNRKKIDPNQLHGQVMFNNMFIHVRSVFGIKIVNFLCSIAEKKLYLKPFKELRGNSCKKSNNLDWLNL